MTSPKGPVYVGGFEEVVIDEDGQQYILKFLPDLNNDQLQREGKAPYYYYLPGSVRIARNGDKGDYKFRHIHFVGVLDETTHVGVDGHSEVAGGILTVTTTARPPASVLKKAQDQLLAKFRGSNANYWGWRTPATPLFSMVPIVSNTTAMSNLIPASDGVPPVEANPIPSSGNGPMLRSQRAKMPRTVPHGAAFRAPSNFSSGWAVKMDGQGSGSVTGGENAFSLMMSALPSEVLWAGFHGAYSTVAISQNLQLQLWSQMLEIKITGHWDRVFEHFSAAAQGRYLWFSADIKAEFNNLRINGGIEVKVEIDGTTPGAEQMAKDIDKRIDLIVEKFTAQAMKVIFEPPVPEVKAAEAPSGGIFSSIFGGVGVALKYRRDERNLHLTYTEKRNFRYLQPETISSSLEGFFNEIKKDPAAEKKYFTRLILGDLSRKITRIVKPVVNWPDRAQQWVGEPVSMVSVQIGYPDARGTIQWAPKVFQSTDTNAGSNWNFSLAQRSLDEVANPPAGWTPDKTFVKRRVHLLESTGATDNPYMQVYVEQNVIDLDPGENGSLLNDNTLEVRAESAGKLEAMLALDVVLEDARQFVEVELQALGQTKAGNARPITRFQWKFEDQDKARYWEIFTGQLDYLPSYQYRVNVIVKGSIFTKGMTWQGPWVSVNENGPCMMHVPTPDEEGVTMRNLTAREITAERVTFAPANAVTPVVVPPAPPVAVGNGGPAGVPPLSKPKKEQMLGDRTVNGYDMQPPSSAKATSEELPLSAKPTLSERLADSVIYRQMLQEDAAMPELEVTVGRAG